MKQNIKNCSITWETGSFNWGKPAIARLPVWSDPVIWPVSVRSGKCATQMVTNGKREKKRTDK